MASLTVQVVDAPSRSKGWARYQLSRADDSPAVSTSTGNPWVGATTKSCEATPGETLTLTSQVMLRVGNARTAREQIDTRTYALVADPDAVAEIEHRPGSQGQRLRVTGARMAAVLP